MCHELLSSCMCIGHVVFHMQLAYIWHATRNAKKARYANAVLRLVPIQEWWRDD